MPPDLPSQPTAARPDIRSIGVDGVLVRFGTRLDEAANRAALAFRAAIAEGHWDGLCETATSLASVYLRFDPAVLGHGALTERIEALIATRDWSAAALPAGRRRWSVPTVFGTDLAPQLEEAAALAGVTPEAAIETLSTTPVRVLTIGFLPGQPYLGMLPEAWDIPRQGSLTAEVPAGALTVAVRQFVLFAGPSPTGWRHVGQTAFRPFRRGADVPFSLEAGDEVVFTSIGRAEYEAILQEDTSGLGGAVAEDLP